MDFFDVVGLLGGLALFLYGMNVMGDGLAKVAGGKMERILENLTSSPLRGVLLGAIVTAVIQSSSATTVMVVGFVNSGIMKLTQAVGVIMGANIGTTATSWILSLSGIEGSNFFVQLCKPSTFAPILAVVGIVLIMFIKNDKKKDIGMIMVGFAVLMTGMDTMSGSVSGLKNVPEFTSILTRFSNPILGLLAGAILTAIIQSSSASVGILQALCSTGAVNFSVALPIIMGQNIGTCVTALLSGIGANKNARRASMVHLYFNVIGTLAFMCIFYLVHAFVDFAFMGQAANAAGIAVVHSCFNVFATIVLLPCQKLLLKLACLTIPDEKESEPAISEEDKEFMYLDARFLEKPAFAMQQSRHASVRMAEGARDCLLDSFTLMRKYEDKVAERVAQLESKVDRYEDELGTYLMKLNNKSLTKEDSRDLSIMLHCIGDLERISDHAINVMEAAQELKGKGLSFSDAGKEEVGILMRAVEDIVKTTISAFIDRDSVTAAKVEPLEEVIDGLSQEVKARHIQRLRDGRCTIEMGFILSDITTGLERVADHCSNIAVCVMQMKEGTMDAHSYLGQLEDQAEFKKNVEQARRQYLLP